MTDFTDWRLVNNSNSTKETYPKMIEYLEVNTEKGNQEANVVGGQAVSNYLGVEEIVLVKLVRILIAEYTTEYTTIEYTTA